MARNEDEILADLSGLNEAFELAGYIMEDKDLFSMYEIARSLSTADLSKLYDKAVELVAERSSEAAKEPAALPA